MNKMEIMNLDKIIMKQKMKIKKAIFNYLKIFYNIKNKGQENFNLKNHFLKEQLIVNSFVQKIFEIYYILILILI